MVSIITVGMNHLIYIKELYRSIYAKETKPNVSFEAIYVDNCSKMVVWNFFKRNIHK